MPDCWGCSYFYQVLVQFFEEVPSPFYSFAVLTLPKVVYVFFQSIAGREVWWVFGVVAVYSFTQWKKLMYVFDIGWLMFGVPLEGFTMSFPVDMIKCVIVPTRLITISF